jgi:putative ABC transport system permease protein
MGKNLSAVTPGTLKDAMINEIPEIKNATKCRTGFHTLEYNANLFDEFGFLFTDPDFLNIFNFPVISGNPIEALKEPFALFVTEKMALKYFGNENPIGKTIKADNKYTYTVKGVIEDTPQNSHITFDFLTGLGTYYSIYGGKEEWNSFSYSTYFQLEEDSKLDDVNDKLNGLATKYLADDPFFKGLQFISQPLEDIHLDTSVNWGLGSSNDIRYLYLISFIGIFILLIACFNYMNIATAKAYAKGRDIGILKVLGSSKTSLTVQFTIESIFLSFGGLILALIIVWIFLPVFGNFTDRPLSYSMIFESFTLIKVIILSLFTGVIAGFYPALHLSSFSSLSLIKENFKNIGGKSHSGKLRNVLVVLQYVISIVALICTLTVLHQIKFISNTDIGFVKDNIITVNIKDPVIRRNPDVLISELSQNPNIIDVVASANLPVTIGSNSRGLWEGKPEEHELPIFKAGIGNHFIDFYQLKIVAGRGFSDDFSSDTVNSFIINETAAKNIGWTDPIGKKLGLNKKKELGTVIGVIKDFHFHSLHLDIEPLALSAIGNSDFKYPRYISIKVRPGTIAETYIFVEKKLKELSPHYINSVSILSDRIDTMYSSDRRLASVLVFSSILAFVLTCLGQYSYTSYSTKKRTKEMVIRKINGAQPITIMKLLAYDAARFVFVSTLFAWPISYYIMTNWLQNFAYRVSIQPAIFLGSGFIALLISILVISFHTIKLSRVNPSELMRYE